MVFNATSNNISVISWWSVLPMEKTTNLPQVTDKLYHMPERDSNFSGFRHWYIGSYISNYHAITTAPMIVLVKMRSFK